MNATHSTMLALREAVRDAIVALADKQGDDKAVKRFGFTPWTLKRYRSGYCPSYTAALRLAPKAGVKA